MHELHNDLIQQAANGDAQALRMVIETLQPLGYSVAFRFAGEEKEAEDILQEAFIKLWKNLKSYRKEVKLTTWFYRIVANQALDYLKSREHRTNKNRVMLQEGYNVAQGSTPDSDYQRSELVNFIHVASSELTPSQKAAFILRDLEGLSAEEVSEILSTSVGNIKSNLFHARKAMAEKLKKHYNEKPTFP